MNFSEALKAMKMGLKVARESWRGKNSYCAIITEPHTKKKFISKTMPDGSNIIMHFIDSEEVLAEDWWIVT